MAYKLDKFERQIAATLAQRTVEDYCDDPAAELDRIVAEDREDRGFLVRSPGAMGHYVETRIHVTTAEQKAAIVEEATRQVQELAKYDY
jgi:hypothetical protein